MPYHRLVTAAAVLFVGLLAVGAAAGPLEVKNCSKPQVSINFDVYNKNDTVRWVPYSSASDVRGGESRMLGCATDRCLVAIDFAWQIDLFGPATALTASETVRNLYWEPVPSSTICVRLIYDDKGHLYSKGWGVAEGCTC